MGAKMKYEPKTGSHAGKINRKRVQDYLKKHPGATGVEIAKALKLSLPTIYGHLRFLK